MIKHVSNNIQNAILMELFKAKESIKIAVAWFTNELLLQPLILKLQTGVSVELILNDDEINRRGESSLDFSEFIKAGGILRWNKSKQLMHDKFCIIDNRIVISGSYNWTNKAEYNSETVTFLYNENESIDFFDKRFQQLLIDFNDDTDNKNSKIEDIDDAYYQEDIFYIDEFGVKYSEDKRILVEGCDIDEYIVNDRTEIIGKHAFMNKEIRKIVISNNVRKIECSAFQNCQNLDSVVLGTRVSIIEDRAFYEDSKLKSILFPKSLVKIGDAAFGDTKLESIIVPKNVKSIGKHAFDNNKLSSIIVEPGNMIYDSRDNCNAIIETASNMLIVACKNTIIPHGVKEIGEHAFYRLSSISVLNIPDSIIRIEQSAFWGCSRITSLTIPASVCSIGKGAFDLLNSLEELTILNPQISLPSYLFFNDGIAALHHVHIPSGSKQRFQKMLKDENNRFHKISLIEDAIVTKERIEQKGYTIGRKGEKYSLDNKTLLKGGNIETYIIEKDVEEIGERAFDSCEKIKNILMPSGLIKIGSAAFSHCTSLEKISIGPLVKDIGRDFGLFAGCNSLQSVIVSQENPKYDSRSNCNAVIETRYNKLIAGCHKTRIPNTITAIGHEAFRDCVGLEHIIIPLSVKNIEEYAFYDCVSLQEVDIPYFVSNIGLFSFSGCSSLLKITINSPSTKIDFAAFSRCTSLQKVIVPKGCTERFRRMMRGLSPEVEFLERM